MKRKTKNRKEFNIYNTSVKYFFPFYFKIKFQLKIFKNFYIVNNDNI